MVLVLGGAYQNKLQYTLDSYKILNDNVADGYLAEDKKVIYNLQDFIFSQIKNGNNPTLAVEDFINKNNDKIFICNEVGAGIVPIEPIERQYRETVGRICTLIAQKSDNVHRVVCGIGQVIKGD